MSMYTVLCGGVGGAKLVAGLARHLAPSELTIIVNTADDLQWHGLYVSPDVDTVLYTLAGLASPETGWGIAGDTRHALTQLGRYGLETWFGIGDRDLATHLARTCWMREGLRYTDVVARLAQALGVGVRVLPMSDAPVRTVIETAGGDLEFQEYFVHRRANVPITGIRFVGIEQAKPTPEALQALRSAAAVIVGPSNPFVSIGPILALAGVRQVLRERPAPVIAVSPIVGGRALKGPAGRMLTELGHPASAIAVATLYADFLDGFVLDAQDADLADEVRSLGLRALVTDTVMKSMGDRARLARAVLDFVAGWQGSAP